MAGPSPPCRRIFPRAGRIAGFVSLQALEDLLDFPLTRYPHDLFLPRVWELRNSVTADDGVHLALAEALQAPLVTRYAALASAVAHDARVELV